MKFKKEIAILFLILFLAGFLRFWQLGQVPPSPDWDEAALGYNAYSIMTTGKDEYGARLPLILRSFDDYKPAVYAYLAMLPIKIFGLNVFAVRFPSALLGTLTVLLVYYLVNELFINELKPKNKPVNSLTRNKLIALSASFLLAISPWHLQFSRIAFESNVGTFFNILVVLLFLKGLRQPRLLLAAAFLAGLNIYVYQAEKVFTPLLVVILFLVFRKEILNVGRKYLFLAIGVGLLLILPFFYLSLTTPAVFLRAKGTSFAADQTSFLAQTAQRLQRDYEKNDFLGLILDNRRINYLLTFANGYFSHFDLNWLFLTGDEGRHHAPGMGLLYLWELPFLLWGIYSLLFGKLPAKAKLLIFGWILIAPVASAFSSGAPHAVRTLRALPMPQILIALGLLEFWNYTQKQKKLVSYGLRIAGWLFFIFNLAYYLNQYFVQQNYFNSSFWQYGYRQAIEEVQKIEPRYQQIIVSNQPHLDQSYIFFLFYLKYPPADYQKLGGTISGGFAETHKGFGKYTFRPIRWDEEEKKSSILYVGRPGDFPAGAKVIKLINFLDGQPAIKLVEG